MGVKNIVRITKGDDKDKLFNSSNIYFVFVWRFYYYLYCYVLIIIVIMIFTIFCLFAVYKTVIVEQQQLLIKELINIIIV